MRSAWVTRDYGNNGVEIWLQKEMPQNIRGIWWSPAVEGKTFIFPSRIEVRDFKALFGLKTLPKSNGIKKVEFAHARNIKF